MYTLSNLQQMERISNNNNNNPGPSRLQYSEVNNRSIINYGEREIYLVLIYYLYTKSNENNRRTTHYVTN